MRDFYWTLGYVQASCRNSYSEYPSSKYINTPNYPSNYGNGVDCTWQLSAPPGTRIILSTFSYSLENHSNCGYDYLKIYDGGSTSSSRLATKCGSGSGGTYYSSGRKLFLRFHSDGSTVKKGFRIYYSIFSNVNSVYHCGDKHCYWGNYHEGVDWGYYSRSNNNCVVCKEKCTRDPNCGAVECGGTTSYCSWWKIGKCATVSERKYKNDAHLTCVKPID